MSASDQDTKLSTISRLSAAELPGYEAEVKLRGNFPGEVAAILQRKIQLKIKVK